MNEDPPSPFDTIGDEPVEARIVAWVLGEASAFEAAELERLCEERPELLVFRRRMRALHGLLTEAEASEEDHSWKLPPEKRKLLDEICGEDQVVHLEPAREQVIRSSGRRAALAIAACLVISFAIFQLIPKPYESETVIEIRPSSRVSPLGSGMREVAAVSSEQFFGTEVESIKNRKSLEKVVDKLELTQRWKMDKNDALQRLKKNVTSEQIEGTDLIAIRVKEQNKQDADEISVEVAKTYQTYRQEIENKESEKALYELNKAVRDQEDKVEERRKVLATIVRTKGIIYKGEDSFYGHSGSDEDEGTRSELAVNDTREDAIKRGLSNQDYVDVKRDYETDMDLLNTLRMKQIGATIGSKSPSQSVIIHETPFSQLAETAAIPASPAVPRQPAAMTMSLAKEKDGFSDAQQYKKRERLAFAGKAEPTVSETEPQLPELAESSNLAALPPPSARGLSTVDLAGNHKGFGGGLPTSEFKEDDEKLASSTPSKASDASIYRNNFDAIPNTPNLRKSDALLKIGSSKLQVTNSAREETMPKLAGKDSSIRDPRPRVAPQEATPTPSEDAIRRNAATTHLHDSKVDQLRRDLYTAEGNFNLGKYDDAKKSYEDVIRVDPYNAAARRGLERVSRARSDYYRAAYDHTRAELLSQVDASWELSVPTEIPTLEEKNGTNLKELRERLENIREQLEEPVIADTKKQSLFKEWEELKKQIEAAQDGEPQAEIAEAQPMLTDFIEEIPASENPYSTFSLNISDASFQLAKAALAKGERPDPASIKTEQFYNAVDYGDAAPAANEPVAATIEQSAHPVIPGRNLVRVALRTGSVGRSAVQPLRLTLLVDQSGSMVREDRRASMEHALAQLGVLLTKNDLVTVIGFSRTPHLLADGMTGDQATKLADLVNQTASEGGTNLEEAMKLGGQLAQRHHLTGAQNRIVLFTDGAANLGDADPARLAEQVKIFRQRGFAFDIAGIGADGLNDKLLGELVRHGNGRYYVVGSEKTDSFAKQLAGAFRPAAENVKVQVNFNPQRVGKYKLIGFEKDRLKTEDFRNDAVDAAELAAEEAGVAIYQVETLPDGSGEIGEVSVRFRDAASKEMVERTWTMPHEPSVVAFDRATPSMQLAGLSLLAAEKLKGGPLADAIDFKLLSGVAAEVKQFYGASTRVGEMLQVIEKLK